MTTDNKLQWPLLILAALSAVAGACMEPPALPAGSPAPAAPADLGIGVAAEQGTDGSTTDEGAAPAARPPAGGTLRPGPTADLPIASLSAGRLQLHRLNRSEYNNTTRDLLGTSQRPADRFPADDLGYGYDNIADVLSLSPVLLEMYYGAAEALVNEAMTHQRQRYEGELIGVAPGVIPGDARVLTGRGRLAQAVTLPAPGRYRIAVRAWATQAGDRPTEMWLDASGIHLQKFQVTASAETPAVYETELTIETSQLELGMTSDEAASDPNGAVRSLAIDWIEYEGPLAADAPEPLRARVLRCEPGEADPPLPCFQQIAVEFGRRAYRRPLTDAEVESLASLAAGAVESGDDVEVATRLMLQAILVSPHFLFRVEHDPGGGKEGRNPLSSHELASRLSYFLWSSMPDETLLDLADADRLQEPETLKAQVVRMLADPRAEALISNFAGQWLHIRKYGAHLPDPIKFYLFDPLLREAMRTETESFIREFFFGQATMDQLLTADFSYVNDRLATHYGLPTVGSDQVRRTDLNGSERGGLLTHGGFLMVTSHSTRTSPVNRGKWVLGQLLCSEPPPPPPNVASLPSTDQASGALRERLQAHRADPVCASCHAVMDPIGFALEHYDPVGAYRHDDEGFPIDASGSLSGESFDGAFELAALLSRDPRLPRCVAQQLFTYALGRALEPTDQDALDAITAGYLAGGQHLRDLITEVVLSAPFRSHRAAQVGP